MSLRIRIALSLVSLAAQLCTTVHAQPAPPVVLVEGEAPPGPIPPAFPPAIPNIDYGARMRIATKLQGVEDPERLDDIAQELAADLYMNGQLHRSIKWTASVTIAYSGAAGSSNVVQVQPLDVTARYEPWPELNFAMGRMIVVADRFLLSGPWGMDEFFYYGFLGATAAPALPKAGPASRDLGVNVWGAPFAGLFKYYVGAYQFHDPALHPLWSGRLQLSLLNGEPAFYQRTTYFGTKDLLSFGVGGQFQEAGSVQLAPSSPGMPAPTALTDDHMMITTDVVLDKNVGEAGTVSAYAAYSKFAGDYRRWDHYWVASLGYMLPNPIGIGKVRGTVRYQRGREHATGAVASSVLEAQLSYNIMAWFARIQLGYRRMEMYQRSPEPGLVAGNQIYLGVTLADP